MATNIIQGNLTVNGQLSASSTSLDGAISNSDISASAAIAHTKQEHQHTLTYGQNGAFAAGTIVMHCVYGATGEVLAFKAGNVTANTGGNDCTVDLQKDGVSVLSAVINLAAGSPAAYTPESGTIVTTGVEDLVAGDVLTVVIVDTDNADCTGLYATVTLSEDPAP